MEKQKLLYEQNRLAGRGAAETVLLYISASKGENNEMLQRTLQLGISLLHGGNRQVQKVKKRRRFAQTMFDIGFSFFVSANVGLSQRNERCRLFHLDRHSYGQLQRFGSRHIRTLYQS